MVLTMSGKSFVRRDFLTVRLEHLCLVCVNVVFHKPWFVASCARDPADLILSDLLNKSQKSRSGILCPKDQSLRHFRLLLTVQAKKLELRSRQSDKLLQFSSTRVNMIPTGPGAVSRGLHCYLTLELVHG